jgi:hypothetical protein
MESLYSKDAKVVTIIAGDFNTDPTEPRFVSEQTFSMLRDKFEWTWVNVPLAVKRGQPFTIVLVDTASIALNSPPHTQGSQLGRKRPAGKNQTPSAPKVAS